MLIDAWKQYLHWVNISKDDEVRVRLVEHNEHEETEDAIRQSLSSIAKEPALISLKIKKFIFLSPIFDDIRDEFSFSLSLSLLKQLAYS